MNRMTNFRIMTLLTSDSDAIPSRWRHYNNRIASLSEEKKTIFFHYKSTQNETLSIFIVFS